MSGSGQPNTADDGEARPSGGGVLAGVRVLDLSRILSGPFATMIMADLGADVVKIEDTGSGDDTREWAPPFQGDQSAYFLAVNRNKRSLSLDLKSSAGREVALKLADRADVVVQNFRPGAAERLGLGYEQLSARNPGLVYASISGYGATGPMAHEPGYDAIAQALSGMMSVTGPAGGEPCRVGVSSADLGAGMWALIGILAALRHREITGRGDMVDVSLLDGQVAWLTYVAGGFFATGAVPPRYGSAHPTIVPYQAFPSSDGHVMVAAGNDDLFRRLAGALGRPELADDDRYATNPDRVVNRDGLLELIAEVMGGHSTQHWVEALAAASVPAAPINDVPAALAHPQVVARDMVLSVEHPTAGTLQMVGNPVKMAGHTATVRLPPPLLGQHTDEVLAELGLSSAEVASLRASGAVR
ncbi:MAG TPA: CaiB/BaiF CoA-transferase family protein [Acidimicrobiales bacterium]|nr:CaiB/BaiF CoA-transferase family protein [Acidimicrobiales bacterium]